MYDSIVLPSHQSHRQLKETQPEASQPYRRDKMVGIGKAAFWILCAQTGEPRAVFSAYVQPTQPIEIHSEFVPDSEDSELFHRAASAARQAITNAAQDVLANHLLVFSGFQILRITDVPDGVVTVMPEPKTQAEQYNTTPVLDRMTRYVIRAVGARLISLEKPRAVTKPKLRFSFADTEKLLELRRTKPERKHL